MSNFERKEERKTFLRKNSMYMRLPNIYKITIGDYQTQANGTYWEPAETTNKLKSQRDSNIKDFSQNAWSNRCQFGYCSGRVLWLLRNNSSPRPGLRAYHQGWNQRRERTPLLLPLAFAKNIGPASVHYQRKNTSVLKSSFCLMWIFKNDLCYSI